MFIKEKSSEDMDEDGGSTEMLPLTTSLSPNLESGSVLTRRTDDDDDDDDGDLENEWPEDESDHGIEADANKKKFAMSAEEHSTRTKFLKLMIGVIGIYSAFLYYGSLQEDVFRFESPQTGTKFTQAWFLQVLEAATNVFVGYLGLRFWSGGSTPNLPLKLFAYSGISQVSSKAANSLALAHGLSFPVATLAKSCKMAPIMVGSLFLGGATYGISDYAQVTLVIAGTMLVSMGKKKSSKEAHDSLLGVFYILLSLALGGVTGGYQKRLQRDCEAINIVPKQYDFMFWTNLFMCGTAIFIGLVVGDLHTGVAYCMENPEILSKILQFSACSAVGQSFVFYTLANFDPLITATVTTSRKLFSVLISVLFKGNPVSPIGWLGLLLAGIGILMEPITKVISRKYKSGEKTLS